MNIIQDYAVSCISGGKERTALLTTLTTPSEFPTQTERGTELAPGSILWCADTGIKWVLFDRSDTTVTWCDSDDTTSQQAVNI